ncbi:MAG TPA: hypothetical protein VF783_12295 [Terriglobales bacterium]
MFPAGAPGLGLLILRLGIAGMVLRSTMLKPKVSIPLWATTLVIVIAISLCIGALTHFGCIASVLADMAMMFCGIEQDRLELTFWFFVTSALFLLGPGAYSVDCHLFGRRLIIASDSK